MNGICSRVFNGCFVVHRVVGDKISICIINQFIIGKRIVQSRFVDLTANARQFLAQLRKFIVTNFNQRLLLRYICGLQLGDAIQDFLFAPDRFQFVVKDEIRFRLWRQCVGIVGKVFVRWNQRQTRARRCIRNHGNRAAGPFGMLPLCLGKCVSTIDLED